MQIPFSQLFMRKIISASIASFLFSIIYAWLEPDLFDIKNIQSIGVHIHEALSVTCVYLMYAAPAIYTYGTATSLLSEWIACAVTHRQWLRLIITTLLHGIFGLIVMYISLLAAVIFLISDTLIALIRKKPLTKEITLTSLILPLALWIATLIYSNITG
ncbi:hypothetical protein [Paenibacillus sp. YAF4_2]|uniref:hypothetical protein n=1 Tax=Paenibacillus sp. YAF4_2 TaxID=3233085 RepID=UPI003F9C1210